MKVYHGSTFIVEKPSLEILNYRTDFGKGFYTTTDILGNITQGKRRVKSYKVHKVEQVPKDEWITVENMHEPIIDKELFEKAQGLRKVDTRVQNNGERSQWAGILKCVDCGRAMHKKYR